MHTLYGFPFACSLAVHIRLVQLGLPVEVHRVARGSARKTSTKDFATVNDRRKVPTLKLPDGRILTEIVSILDFLDGTQDRRSRLEWLAFLATELHQQVLGPMFDPATPPEALDDVVGRLLPPVLGDLERVLSEQDTLRGGPPDGADAYLFWGTLLLEQRHPNLLSNALRRHRARFFEDPVVAKVVGAERDAFLVVQRRSGHLTGS